MILSIVPKHKMTWRMRVVFAGNLPPKEYVSHNIWRCNPGWGDEIFNRTIETLEFFLPKGHRIFMAGMEQYNFFVEAVQSKKSKGITQIKAFWFLGKLPGKDVVETWRVGDEKVIRKRKPWGHEWGGGPTRGWKQGVPGNIISEIRK